ncbi:MAG: NifB/NifX family molybdenum-iron cluster-binding protein [Armatimonadota bacterium]
MRAAISRDGDRVATHFGRCDGYEIVDIDAQEITGRKTVENPGHEPGALPRMLSEMDVDCVVAGGMGPRAQQHFERYGIRTVVGVSGTIEDAVEALASGDLEGGSDQCHHTET